MHGKIVLSCKLKKVGQASKHAIQIPVQRYQAPSQIVARCQIPTSLVHLQLLQQQVELAIKIEVRIDGCGQKEHARSKIRIQFQTFFVLPQDICTVEIVLRKARHHI